jgi:hypothetical protein
VHVGAGGVVHEPDRDPVDREVARIVPEAPLDPEISAHNDLVPIETDERARETAGPVDESPAWYRRVLRVKRFGPFRAGDRTGEDSRTRRLFRHPDDATGRVCV